MIRKRRTACLLGLFFVAAVFPPKLAWGRLAWGWERAEVVQRFSRERPQKWGIDLKDILMRLPVGRKITALTLDACDGRKSGYDYELIEYLKENEIPATLFVSGKWIDAHRDTFLELAMNPLFEIENHGALHKPLSVAGKSAYRIRGTADIGEVFDEVEGNARKIENLTGRKPVFFRSGTAHYDDVAVRIVDYLGYKIAGFSVNGDGGGTLPSAGVGKALLSVREGDIVLMHMNRPGSGTLPGLKQSIPLLKERGFCFVRLSEMFEAERPGKEPARPQEGPE